MNLILSWALGIVHIYIKALHVHRKWDATEKQQKKKVIHTSIASKHPLASILALGCVSFLSFLSDYSYN